MNPIPIPSRLPVSRLIVKRTPEFILPGRQGIGTGTGMEVGGGVEVPIVGINGGNLPVRRRSASQCFHIYQFQDAKSRGSHTLGPKSLKQKSLRSSVSQGFHHGHAWKSERGSIGNVGDGSVACLQ